MAIGQPPVEEHPFHCETKHSIMREYCILDTLEMMMHTYDHRGKIFTEGSKLANYPH